MLWFLRNVARNSPTCISNIEIASLEFCGFLDTYEKLGYPNYVRVLVDEAPKANSCVRSSSHDTVHDPRDASNTTPTPHNAKSRLTTYHGHAWDLPGSALQEVLDAVKAGEMSVPIAGVFYGLEQVPDAHRAMESHEVPGKNVVVLG
mgnify:CR=1 FL=1